MPEAHQAPPVGEPQVTLRLVKTEEADVMAKQVCWSSSPGLSPSSFIQRFLALLENTLDPTAVLENKSGKLRLSFSHSGKLQAQNIGTLVTATE